MSGVFGGKKAKSQSTKAVSALQVQTSTFGVVLPLLYGKNRIAGNLGWYGNWIPTAHTEKQSSGGKGGGGGGSTSTSYTYTTGVILLLSEGPINGIGTVWKDKELHTLSDLGFTLFNGTSPQSPWTWLQSYNSSQAIAYSGMAYVGASALQLGSSTGLPNLNFEVKGLQLYNPGVVDDALPSDILTDYLTDSVHGAGFGGYLGSTAQLRAYSLARGLFMSPIEDQQRTAADFVNDMAKWCNFAPVWSYNQLLLLPYGDAAITGTYGTYTPNLTPLYDLGPDDFLYEDGSDCGVELDWKELEQCHNSVRIEYNDRANSYNTVSQEAKDQADIDSRGAFPMSSISVNGITSAQVARDVAQLMLQRDLYIRKTYHFRTGMRYMLLEPMDIITLTDPNAGLNRELVRITKVTEENDELEFEAEELPIGVASAPQYAPQASGGYSQDFNVSPGSVSPPVIFNAPGLLTQGGFETWIAVAGIGQYWGGCDVYASEDNTTYQRVGRITGAARYGALTSALAVGADPDTTHTPQLSLLRGQLNSGTTADADNWRQLAFIGGASGGELISFRDATLTGTLSYQLSYLRRAGYGSTNQAHVSGDVFVRIDEAIFRIPYDQGKRGNTVYFKFVSFNVFGSAMEQLSAVTAYSHVLGASDVLAPPKLYDQLAGQYAAPASGSNFIPNPSFELNNIHAPAGNTLLGTPVCDSWYISEMTTGAFTAGRDSTVPDVGNNDMQISAVAGFSVAASALAKCRLVSAPIYVSAGQILSYNGDIRTESAGGNGATISWTAAVGMLFYDASGNMVSGGNSFAGPTLAANSPNPTYTKYSTNQFTVPAGASYAVAYVYLEALNTSSSAAATLNSWTARFDNLQGLFVTAANQVNYTTGQSVDSLKPAQAGADVTANQTLVGIVNPGFDLGLQGWTPESDASNWYAETGTNGPNPGTTTYVVHRGSTTTTFLRNAYRAPVVAGQVIKATCKVNGISSPTGTPAIRILFQDISGTDIASPASPVKSGTAGNGVQLLSVSGVAPSNAAWAIISPGVGTGTGGYYNFDDMAWTYQPSTVDEVPNGSSYAKTPVMPGSAIVVGNANFQAPLDSFGNIPGWSAFNGATLAYFTSTASPFASTQCLQVSFSGSSPSGFGAQSPNYKCSAGDTVYGKCWIYSQTGALAQLIIYFFSSSNTFLGSSSGTAAAFNAWNQVSASGVAPSGTAYCFIRLANPNTGGGVSYFYDVHLTRAQNLANEVAGTLSTQKNLPTVTFGNYGSGWSGLTFSYTATTTSATISASAATLQAGSDTVSYNASSVSVSGSAGTTVKYYLYYDDPLLAGGSQTLQATTSNITAMANNNRLFLGSFSVTYPTSGTGGGSGGGQCVTVDSWLPGHGAAGSVGVGDKLELVVDAATFARRAGRVNYAQRKLAPCVRIITESGISLDCSTSAPILCSDETLVLAPDLIDQVIPVSDFGEHRHERVVAVEDIGDREVIHITCENSVFLAGRQRGRYIGHHNLKPT